MGVVMPLVAHLEVEVIVLGMAMAGWSMILMVQDQAEVLEVGLPGGVCKVFVEVQMLVVL